MQLQSVRKEKNLLQLEITEPFSFTYITIYKGHFLFLYAIHWYPILNLLTNTYVVPVLVYYYLAIYAGLHILFYWYTAIHVLLLVCMYVCMYVCYQFICIVELTPLQTQLIHMMPKKWFHAGNTTSFAQEIKYILCYSAGSSLTIQQYTDCR